LENLVEKICVDYFYNLFYIAVFRCILWFVLLIFKD